MSEKCPKCGADRVACRSARWYLQYACGTVGDDAGNLDHSTQCLRAQLAQLKETHIQACSVVEEQLAQRDAELAQRQADLDELDRHVHERNDDTGTVDAAIALIASQDAGLERLRAVVDKLHRALNNALVFVAHDSNAYWAGLGALATSSPELPLTVAFADEVIRIREAAEAAKERKT